MLPLRTKILSVILGLTLLFSALSFIPAGASQSSGFGITDANGWFESAYAEWVPINGANSYNAYISDGTNWLEIDSALIRKYTNYYRVDAVGLKAGDYQIKIIPVIDGVENTEAALITSTLTVSAYDRSGYAHFNYSEGVGAYNDDGTLKDGAIVIYVTEENKNTVSVTSKDGTTVTGIGNILNTVGKDVGNGRNSKGGTPNTNSDILKKLANDGTPLVVRIIGNVTAPAGLTAYNSVDYGGSVGDNGFMARMSGARDITIEGIGSDAMMNGWGLHFICQTDNYLNGFGKSFEVRNITFKNVPEDCVGMEGQQENSTLTAPVERCWIHNCTFYAPTIAKPAESDKSGGDGACDFKRGQYFTNSYCHYIGYHKTNLVGSSDDSLQYHMTYHHNYWEDCESRGPLARQANIHMYNNIFEGQVSYCMNPRANAYIFSEYNMFYKSKNPVKVDSGAVKSYNDSFTSCTGDNDATVVNDRSVQVSSSNKFKNFDTNSAISYIPSGDYIIQESISEMKAVVMAYAGAQKDKILTPDSVNTSVIPTNQYPTAAVVLDYTKSINKTTVPTSGTYDNIVFNASKFNANYIGLGSSSTDCNIVFYVDTAVNITVTQYADSANNVVLCDEIGQCLLVGSGTVENLPSGYYFLQSDTFDVGSGKYKEAKISALTITAVDPNAAPNPIPTPPSGDNNGSEDNTGSGDNTGSSGNEGSGGTVTDGTIITENSETHSFTKDGKTDPEGFFSISGNTSTSKGSVTFNNETLTTCLKIESSTNISFNAAKSGIIVLVFGGSTNAAGKAIKVNGTSYDIPTSQILEISLGAGSHSITKDDSINLFYMAFVPTVVEHTHSYLYEDILDSTCTESGLRIYTCNCGESYTEEVEPLGHSYNCEINDATCTEAGLRTYTCDCGESYTEDINPIGHRYDCEMIEATCTEAGSYNYTCECGDSYEEAIEPLGHKHTLKTAINPTCTKLGLLSYVCKCGDTYIEEVEPLAHSYEDGICKTCGESESVDTPDDNENEDQPDNDENNKHPNDNETGDLPSDDSDENINDSEEKLGFFERILKAIIEFFQKLFGIKKY